MVFDIHYKYLLKHFNHYSNAICLKNRPLIEILESYSYSRCNKQLILTRPLTSTAA